MNDKYNHVSVLLHFRHSPRAAAPSSPITHLFKFNTLSDLLYFKYSARAAAPSCEYSSNIKFVTVVFVFRKLLKKTARVSSTLETSTVSVWREAPRVVANFSSTFLFFFLHSLTHSNITSTSSSSSWFNCVAMLFRRFTTVSSHRAASIPNANRSTSFSSWRYFLLAAMLFVLISFLISWQRR